MKNVLVFVIIVILGVVVWSVTRAKPDATVPNAVVTDQNVATDQADNTSNSASNDTSVSTKVVDNSAVSIKFKGFGPGKSHEGTFEKITSNLSFSGESLTGTVEVDMNTLTTPDGEKLINHLKSKDFFDVAVYPKSTFKVTSMKDDTITGAMTIHGVTKSVSFPFVILESYPMQYSAKFNINMQEFGIDQKFANEVIELSVTVPVK